VFSAQPPVHRFAHDVRVDQCGLIAEDAITQALARIVVEQSLFF